jgi:hypothetical protein
MSTPCTPVQVQLLQDVRAVGLDRRQADVEHGGDFLVGAAFGG